MPARMHPLDPATAAQHVSEVHNVTGLSNHLAAVVHGRLPNHQHHDPTDIFGTGRGSRTVLARNPDLAAAVVKIRDEAIRYWHLAADANRRAGHPFTADQERYRASFDALAQAIAIIIGQPITAVADALDTLAKQTPTPADIAPISGVDA